VEERREVFGVEPICRAVGVPVSTYYARRSRKPSRRALADRELVSEIYAAREGYRSVYGVRKTWKELKRRDIEIGRDRVARLMRQEGLEGVRRGKKRRTTIPDEAALERARDLLQRDFTATGPNEKWVARHHVRPHLERLRLPRLHPRLLQPDDRRLAAGDAPAHRPGVGRARDGQRAPATGRGADRAHRSRLAVHEHPLHRPPRRARRRPLGRLARRRLRQRHGRGVGRDLQERARRRTPLPQLRAVGIAAPIWSPGGVFLET